MEPFRYFYDFGDIVRRERKKLKMNQVSFYRYLFPNETKAEETIKKKMNAIENGKQKSVDFIFLIALCQKCNVSADYILGLSKDFRNHTNEFIHDYTGLEEPAIEQLHKWSIDLNNGTDLSIIDKAFNEEQEETVMNAFNKQSASIFLRIINHLFWDNRNSSKENSKNRRYSNLSILHSLYLMCMEMPKSLTGTFISQEDTDTQDYIYQHLSDPYAKQLYHDWIHNLSLDGTKYVFLKDTQNVTYPINLKTILEQIARNKLNKALDRLIASVNNDNIK